MYRSKTLNMKTHSLLFIASLAVLASSASAASNQTQPEVLVLPTYVVTSPRHSTVEQKIDASLKEFREQALVPMTIAPEVGLLLSQTSQHKQLANAARTHQPGRIAKS